MMQVVDTERSYRGQTTYEYMNLEVAQPEKTYQNIGGLLSKIVILCFSSFYFGYCLTYLSTFSTQTTAAVYGDNANKSAVQGVLIGVLTVGAIVGAGIAPLLMRPLSRKEFILVINFFALIVEGVLQINNVYVLLVCRAFQGIFVGCYMSIVPIYINELAPRQIVGSFGVFTQLFVVIALVVSYGMGLIMQTANTQPFVFYRISVSANAVFIVIQSVLMIVGYIPQSPNSLIRKNRNQEAMKVIGQFTIPSHVERQFKNKQLEVDNQMAKETTEGKDGQEPIKYSMKAYLLGFQLPFMQQLTGINAIVTQARNIVSHIMPELADYIPIIIVFIQLLATMCTIAVLTRFGRKPLTLFGNLGLALTDIIIGVFFVFQSWEPSGYIIFGLLIIYMIIYGISLGPVVWLYVPQIIPAKIVPLATMMNWLGCSICLIFTPIVINDNDGNPYPVFFFYGAVTFVFFIINCATMVETKGRTTRQIALEFQ